MTFFYGHVSFIEHLLKQDDRNKTVSYFFIVKYKKVAVNNCSNGQK